MADSAELEREIADTRAEIQARVVELRRRTQRNLRRALRVALVVGAVAVVAAAGVVAYRLSRPPTWRERARRLVPAVRRPLLRLPKIRVYVGDERMVGENPTARERLALRAAAALGTAAGAAAMSQLLSRITRRGQAR